MKSFHVRIARMEKNRSSASLTARFVSTTFLVCTIVALFAQKASSFNYDYSSACTRPYRSGRSSTRVPPCDLSKQSYCNLPGTTYPWHAVRRFVHENQGLMRRMYGDQRHISVLKAEIENNDLDAETSQVPLRDNTYARYSKDWDIRNTKFVFSKKPSGRSNEQFTVPHFRPVQTTPTTTTTTVKTEEITNKPQQKSETQKQTSKEVEDMKLAAYKTSFFEDELDVHEISKTNLEMNKIEPEIVTLEAAIKQSLESNNAYPAYGLVNKSVTTRPATSNITIETSSMADSTTSEYVNQIETTSAPDFDEQSTDSEDEDEGWKPVMMDKVSTLPPTMLFSQSVKEEQNKNDRIDLNTEENYKTQEQSSVSSNTAATTHLEGQLFQDVVQEESKPIVKLRGVNACPVKEEVVAPFWANNTRGEVLALLNLYPFEQYVHWEKCTHEHKQMFCREGCRCEQQYRLHRLLAYDPNNECRGIFSDWFRFPSCCVCKCYDMPLEFRVTSRSPRTIEPELDEAIKREMYQQATSDWYTINLDD